MIPRLLSVAVVWCFLAGFGRLAAGDAAGEQPAAAPASVSFWKDLRPIFQAQCHGCHQPARARGEYVMTDFASLVKGGDTEGTAVHSGRPDDSPLLAIITPDAAGKAAMPKKGPPLKAEEIALVRRWIAEGATDDTPAAARHLWDADHPPVYPRPALITALDFSPDGQWLAVSGFHEVLLLDAAAGALRHRLIGLSERVESLSFSPDGQRLAVTGGQPGRLGEAQVWDMKTRRLALSVPVTFDTLYGGAWSPDGRQIVFGGADKSVRALDASSGEPTFFVLAHDDWVQDTVFSVKGDYIVSVGRDMTAKLSETATQRFVDNITSITPGALKGGLQAVARHPQRDEILVGGSDGEPRLYRLTREVERKIGDDSNLIRAFPSAPGRLWDADYAPDGKSFAVAGSGESGGFVALYQCDFDTALPEEIKAIYRKESFNRNAEEKKKVDEFLRSGVSKLRERTFPAALYALAYAPGGDRLAVAGAAGIIYFIDPATGEILREIQPFPLATAATEVDFQ